MTLRNAVRLALAFLVAWGPIGNMTIAARPAPAEVPAPDPANGDGGVPAFYQWTGRVPARTGKLLKAEPLPTELGLENAGQATRMLYTSLDSVSGRVVVVSGAYFVPKGKPPKGGWPLIAWAHGTTGMADTCAPSTYARSPRDTQYLNSWLAAGFAIVSSDYQGLGTPGAHPYTNFRSHAYAVLDSVRAVRRGPARLSGKVVLLGQSQGAGTAVAAAGYAPDYAPDLRIAGTVATGVPNMIRSAIEAGVPGAATDVGSAAAFLMMAWEWRQSGQAMPDSGIFTPAGFAMGEKVNTMCYAQIVNELGKQDLMADRLLQPGALAQVFHYNLDNRSYPTLRLTQPLFIGQGDHDTTTTVAGALALAEEFCRMGTLVEAHLYAGKDHNGAVNTSAPDGIRFARKVIAGKVITPVCQPQAQ